MQSDKPIFHQKCSLSKFKAKILSLTPQQKTDGYMPPVREDSIKSNQSPFSESSNCGASHFSLSLEKGDTKDEEQVMQETGACASSCLSRPYVSPTTTRDTCRLCGISEDNVKSNFSYLKRDLDPEELLDIIEGKKHLTFYQLEDIKCAKPRRRKVDVMVKTHVFNGKPACNMFMDVLSTTEGCRFIPEGMHCRHICRSKDTVEEFCIESQHIKNNEEYIVDNVDPEEIADLLVEEYVLSMDDHEEIVNPEVHKSRRSKCKEMVKKLCNLNENALKMFIYVLKKGENKQNGKVANKLESVCAKTQRNSILNIFLPKPKTGKRISIKTSKKVKAKVAELNSTDVSLKLTISDKKGNHQPDIETKVINYLKSNRCTVDDLADAFAKLSIKDIKKGSVVIHLQLESTRLVNRFRYAFKTGEIEHFVNELLESANIHTDMPKNGLEVEVDVIMNNEGSAEGNAEIKSSGALKRCIVENMAFLLEELNPIPVMKIYEGKSFFSDSERNNVLAHNTNRRSQVSVLLKTILAKDDEDVGHFLSALQSGKQVHILDRLKLTRCPECIRQKITKHKPKLLEELDSIAIRDTLDRCSNVTYDLYDGESYERKKRIEEFFSFIEKSEESLLAFDDVMFAAGLSFLLEGDEAVEKDVVCSKCSEKENDPSKEVCKIIIKENFERLEASIKAEDILDALVERGALTYRNKIDILRGKPAQKMNILLNTLLTKGSNSCSIFSEVLQEQKYDPSVHQIFHFEYAGGATMGEQEKTYPVEQIPEQHFEYSSIKVVAAIDFGTTYSGFAYSFSGDYSTLKIETKTWKAPSSSKLMSLKAPTTLLLQADKSFEAFGFEANEKYNELAEDDDHCDRYYFKQFKMLLHNKANLTRDTKLVDDQGHELPALDVFAHSIRYLKGELLSSIRAKNKKVEENEIYWVLTVPAIWEEPAKQFMREAAIQAGIPYYRLTLALEPEAASIYVKEMPLERQKEGSESPTLGCFKPGTKYMVLDIGGGTVDTTVTEVLPDKKLQELHQASGGAWGGQKVNEAVLSLFEKVYGEGVMKKFENENKADFLQLNLTIETTKRNVQSAETEKLDIVIPNSLSFAYKSLNIPSEYIGKITVMKNRVRIDKDLFKGLFKPCIEDIVKHAQDILKHDSANDVSYIICVGGFSECEYLQEEIRNSFPNLKVITPASAGLAVLKGAVLYGLNPDIVKSRISRFTYGTAMYRYFMKDYDDPTKLEYFDEKPFCKDVFHKLAELGNSYSVGYVVREDVHPVTADMTKMSVRIYKSTNKDPKYVTDEECTYMGRMVVDMPDTRGGLNRTVEVSLTFGDTELTAKGLDKTTGKEVHVKLDLLS